MKSFKFEVLATTKDGVNVVFDGEIAVDTPVYVIAEDGSKTPAPDGDLTFEDGTIIGVIGGKISSITPPSEDTTQEDMSTEETTETTETTQTNQFEAQMTEFSTQLAELKAEFASIKEMITNLSSEFSNEKVVIEEKFKAITIVEKTDETEKESKKVPSLSALFSAMKK